MTSVPKPLKFLNVHLDTLGARCDQLPPGENRSMLADIVSVLATTVAPKEGERTALKFRLLGEPCNIDDCMPSWSTFDTCLILL